MTAILRREHILGPHRINFEVGLGHEYRIGGLRVVSWGSFYVVVAQTSFIQRCFSQKDE